ncbi:peroxisomal acyl-coenzyme A oxidase 1 [Procambarus clarkii]|uniref:peroxisomal acyl-coenzyme A oxidase 1 n=1 Tax=Procambarus clarkii TaxID=6728 RepID=UPI00374232C4
MAPKSELKCVEDLKRERAKCTFNTEELTNIMDGGKEKTAIRREIQRVLINDPEFSDIVPQDYLSHEDRYGNELRKSVHLMKTLDRLGAQDKNLDTRIVGGVLKDGNPLGLHKSMFLPAIRGQGNAQQQEEWLGRAERAEIIGTYAQTELGHGTFVRGLETTATYDPATQEFVLHSPTITATKWWPGALGKTCNYAVVMAQLYTQGRCHGPHPFVVQLRDENTHRSLPGITVGEIGPRLGLNTNDNGFLRFDHYRIPRNNLLMKHSQVLEDGTYVKPIHSKLSYGTMILVRVGIVYDCSRKLEQAVTIATRYSAVRHQSEMAPGEPEPQILDYQTQQYKLIPQIASVLALYFSAKSAAQIYTSVTASMEKGNVQLLPELHSLSSGLKAVSSDDATSGIEICRLACGGHGYLASSNLPRLYTGTTCAITYEGENTVLLLQVARYLIKTHRAAGRRAPPSSVSHLAGELASSPSLSNKALVEAFRVSASALVVETEARLQKLCDMGREYHHAWNDCSVQLVKCAQAHTRHYICEKFEANVESLDCSEGVRNVLRSLCRLYLIYHITLTQGNFLRCGALTARHIAVLEAELCELLATLRTQAVSIVDAFDIPDALLGSTLGCWDGNVYERLYNAALKSPLNKTDVPKAYYKYLRPLIKSSL